MLYPLIDVERDADGRVAGVYPPTDGGSKESIVHLEVSLITDIDRLESIGAELSDRLQDVVRATDDFRPMMRAVDLVISELMRNAALRPDLEEELQEIQHFCAGSRTVASSSSGIAATTWSEARTAESGASWSRPGRGSAFSETRATLASQCPFRSPSSTEGCGGSPCTGRFSSSTRRTRSPPSTAGFAWTTSGSRRWVRPERCSGALHYRPLHLQGVLRGGGRHTDPEGQAREDSGGGERPGRVVRLQGDHHDLQLHAEGGALPLLCGRGRRRRQDRANLVQYERRAGVAARRPTSARPLGDGHPAEGPILGNRPKGDRGRSRRSVRGRGAELSPRARGGGPSQAPLLSGCRDRASARGPGVRSGGGDRRADAHVGGPRQGRARRRLASRRRAAPREPLRRGAESGVPSGCGAGDRRRRHRGARIDGQRGARYLDRSSGSRRVGSRRGA